jgi:aldose sugar dehydrogenase
MLRAGLLCAVAVAALALSSCGGDGGTSAPPTGGVPTPAPPPPAPPPPSPPPATTAVTATTVATLSNPWAMVFLPDGRMLITERTGNLRVVSQAGDIGPPLTGVPAVDSAGQGGLLDVALDPDFAANKRVYISFSEPGSGGTAGTAVARGTLVVAGNGIGRLDDFAVIWRQTPKVADTRHYGARMAFGPDNKLYITAGERHQGAPAQDTGVTLGKIVRINSDGSIPADNPFVVTAGARGEIWTLGHRNPYGLVFGTNGTLYESEMGPDAGDEFNIITKGANYGWRVVAEGSDGGVALPPHSSHPEFAAPAKFWNPNIAPAGMIQYTGTRFVDWTGDFVLAGLVSQGLVQVRVSGTTASEVRRISLGQRIREVEQGPDGAIWILEDGAAGRLRKLVPAG